MRSLRKTWRRAYTLMVVGCAAIAHASTPIPEEACKHLNQFTLPAVTSIQAEEVMAGKLQPPIGKPITDLPPFCRVLVVASPAPGSRINIEIWLPLRGWNEKFLGTGNGGGGAKIYYPPLRAGLRRGFVTANTDLGTTPNADAAAANPEAWIDFGHRATHVMTLVSKAVIRAYFGQAAQRAYFWGSSTGGQQAMSEAQRYPDDYDGIVAGSPAINRTHLHSYFVWNYQAMHRVEGQSSLTPDEIAQLDRDVLHECAGHDGGAPSDDFLSDPRVCHFDPATMPLCSVKADVGCLTQPQRDALKMLYAGPVNPRTRERIYAPMPPASEASNLGLAYQETLATARQLLYPFLWAFGSAFDPMKFDFDKDEATLDDKLAAIVNANNPDLTAFHAHGGKLILYTGTADPIVPYADEISYYERVVDFLDAHPQPGMPENPLEATQTFFRMYVVPGMGHGGGGPGLDSFGQLIQPTDNDVLYALERWVEQDVPPGDFPAVGWNDGVSSKGIRMRRNVCVYPAFPTYIGGDPSQASSFRCADHPRGSVANAGERYLR
jgi:feruloyl esterase